MDQKMKWSLILTGVIAISGLAIWGLWVLAINHRNNQKEKLEGELIGLIHQASTDAVGEFAEDKSKEALKDTTLVSELTTALGISDFAVGIITSRITSLASEVEKADKDKILGVKASPATDKANGIKSEEIEYNVNKVIKEQTVKIVKRELEEVCKSAAKLATKDAVKEVVENGSTDDQDAKSNIKKKAKEAAADKAKDFISIDKFKNIKQEVKDEGTKILTNWKKVIEKKIIDKAIKLEAKLTK